MGIFGGNAKDFPKPWKLKSECEEKREVSIKIMSYIGLAPGATHFYAEVKEDDDMMWDEENQAWRSFWGCPDEWKGRLFEKQFLSKADARSWIRMIIREHFPSHEISDLFEGQHDWVYVREGD